MRTTKALLLVLLMPVWAWGAVPVIESSSYATTGTSTNDTIYVPKPSGTAEGDVVVLLVCADYNNPGGTSYWTTPSGFTLIQYMADNVQDNDIAAYYKVAGGSEPTTYPVPYTSNYYLVGFGVRLSGCNTSDVLDTTTAGVSANSNTYISDSLLTNHDSTINFVFSGFDGADGMHRPGGLPSVSGTGWNRGFDTTAATLGNGISSVWGYRSHPTAGYTAQATIVYNSTDGIGGFVFAIRGTIAGPATRSQIMRTVIVGD